MKKLIPAVLIFAVFLIIVLPIGFQGQMAKQDLETPMVHIKVKNYPVIGEVIESDDISNMGMSTDTSDLSFGAIPREGSFSTRYLMINNIESKSQRAKIKLEASGNIAPMISFEENNFIIQKGETKRLAVKFTPTNSTDIGEYTGTVVVNTIEPNNPVANMILEIL